jgi:hypothetical protein
MFDTMQIQEEISLAIEFHDSAMPENIRALRRLAETDLTDGPVYLDAEGERVSCFDEDSRRFNFSKACRVLSRWADVVSDVQIEIAYCEETDESEYDAVSGSREQILKSLFGPVAEYL